MHQKQPPAKIATACSLGSDAAEPAEAGWASARNAGAIKRARPRAAITDRRFTSVLLVGRKAAASLCPAFGRSASLVEGTHAAPALLVTAGHMTRETRSD